MILRRASENIRTENWFGVAIEFVLMAELDWHRAAVANQLYQVGILQGLPRTLVKQIGKVQ